MVVDIVTPAMRVTRAVGWGRLAAGGLLVLRPRLLPSIAGFHAGSAPEQEWLVQMMAAREAGLGLGTLTALHTGDSPRPWLWAQAASDAGDAVAFLNLARRPVLRRRALGLAAFALAGVVSDLTAARLLRRPRWSQ